MLPVAYWQMVAARQAHLREAGSAFEDAATIAEEINGQLVRLEPYHMGVKGWKRKEK